MFYLQGTSVDTKKKRKKGKSMFPLSASGDNKTRSITSQECVNIAKLLTNTTGWYTINKIPILDDLLLLRIADLRIFCKFSQIENLTMLLRF
jgi:hypothetical protein